MTSDTRSWDLNTTDHHAVIFYDSQCVLCNKTVLFLLKQDKEKLLKFAPIGGDTYKALNLESKIPTANTVVFLKNGKIKTMSTATLEILYQLPFPWKLTVIFRLIPAPVTDLLYRFVAKNRIRFFGNSKECATNHRVYADAFLR